MNPELLRGSPCSSLGTPTAESPVRVPVLRSRLRARAMAERAGHAQVIRGRARVGAVIVSAYGAVDELPLDKVVRLAELAAGAARLEALARHHGGGRPP
jgi:hypothetical protein